MKRPSTPSIPEENPLLAAEVLDEGHVRQLDSLRESGARSLFCELADLFCREMPRRMERLLASLAERDAGESALLSHRMIAGMASIGARQMIEILGAIERDALACDWEAVGRHRKALEVAWPALLEAIRKQRER